MVEMTTRLHGIEQKVTYAWKAVQADPNVSFNTNATVQDFFNKSQEIIRMPGTNPMRDDIVQLEEIADNAKNAALADSEVLSIKKETLQAIIDAHDSVSSLKRELH